MKVMGGFYHNIARRIAGMAARRGAGGEWEWDSVEVALKATGIWTTRYYLQRMQATIAEYVADWPIYEICTGVERME